MRIKVTPGGIGAKKINNKWGLAARKRNEYIIFKRNHRVANFVMSGKGTKPSQRIIYGSGMALCQGAGKG